MKRTTMVSIATATFLVASTFASAMQPVEPPQNCAQCGMDRTANAATRMLIKYADGTGTGVCSLNCAAMDMKKHSDQQVVSVQVADYPSKELTDARTATWVVGGKMPGGMNNPPAWAFAKQADAQAFMTRNGGQLRTYDQALEALASTPRLAAGADPHAGCDAPGGLMVYNPAFGDDIYHTHPAGCVMVNYKYMHTRQDELRTGTSDVGLDEVGFNRNVRYDYMMIPTSMTMDMHMLMLMYGLTDRFTVMGMGSYQDNKMDMLMDMGPMMPVRPDSPMRTDGFGDTEVRGIYKIDSCLAGSLGLSLPTGDIDQSARVMRWDFRAPYDMQLGSGSYDLKPALTYSCLSDDALWNWGAQVMYVWHTADNVNDYRLGDSIKADTWLQCAAGPAASWVRFAYNHTESIHGQDSEIQKLLYPSDPMMPMKWAPMPDADPANYGGQRIDGAIGVSCKIGPGSIGVEGGIPLYQDLNGLQLKTEWFLTAGAQVMF